MTRRPLPVSQELVVAPYIKGIPVCYCLVLKENDRDCTYIGFTLNMRRRLRQHRRCIKGGAKCTHRRLSCDWVVAAIVHGFLTAREARQFEWAWKRLRGGNKTSPVTRRLQAMKTLMMRNQWAHLAQWNLQNPCCNQPEKPHFEPGIPVPT